MTNMTTSTMRPKLLAATLLIVLGGLALLSSGRSDAAGATATASATKTVSIKGFAFKPATLVVNRGARVAFANASGVPHTATKGGSFDTKRIAPGKSATVRFNQKGTFAYHCKIHPSMRGKIVVE
jgi:plastocyanin